MVFFTSVISFPFSPVSSHQCDKLTDILFYFEAFDTINQMSSGGDDWQIEATWFMKIGM